MCKTENKITVYFVTRVVSLILNISSTNQQYENENKQKDTTAFDL